ncbi:MAG: gamma-glutamyl-gamma-aminobutyrate hydrolase family protein [Phycisphaerales bacterium]
MSKRVSDFARPIIGITADAEGKKYLSAKAYAEAVDRAGGLPFILPHRVELVGHYLGCCHGFILTGGDDPRMEAFGEPTHPKAKPIDAERQDFEVELLRAADDHPTLGVCLGMQLMALVRGGRLDQHLPDTLPTAATHWDGGTHAVTGMLGEGFVHSHHRQAITDPGGLEIAATATDGVIEAVRDPKRPFFVGVQWHPERMDDEPLGAGLFRALVMACERR